MQKRFQATWAAVGIVVTLLAAFAGPAHAADRIKIVTSFSILGDLASRVGGRHVDVTSLVGPNGDPHVFEPSPTDAREIAEAQLVVVNGLGLEGWLDRLIAASKKRAGIVVATRGITPRASDEDHDRSDPHAWQSVANAMIYARNIRDGLIATDPANKADYETNCAAYLDELTSLEKEIKDTVATIPPERRHVLTNHDAFGYFAAAYGITFIALQGMSTDAEPSARDIAAVIRQIKQQKDIALFLENIVNPAQLRRIESETGVRIGGTLYSDALTPKGGAAPDYIALMRHNIQTIAAALKN